MNVEPAHYRGHRGRSSWYCVATCVSHTRSPQLGKVGGSRTSCVSWTTSGSGRYPRRPNARPGLRPTRRGGRFGAPFETMPPDVARRGAPPPIRLSTACPRVPGAPAPLDAGPFRSLTFEFVTQPRILASQVFDRLGGLLLGALAHAPVMPGFRFQYKSDAVTNRNISMPAVDVRSNIDVLH